MSFDKPRATSKRQRRSRKASTEQPPMPVDAVFLGTLAMATSEAMTSPQVKQALVDASIYYLENDAAKAGRLLDALAKQPDTIEARKQEVIAAFTAGELAYNNTAVSGDRPRHLAARFAAKEAATKAFDLACAAVGITPGAINLKEIEVTRDAAGRPWLSLHGSASRLADEIGADRAWLSLSHDGDYAAAVVALERLS